MTLRFLRVLSAFVVKDAVALAALGAAAGCLAPHELRPLLAEREVGEDFIFESAEARELKPNRYIYTVEAHRFGPLPRIWLEPRVRFEIDDNREPAGFSGTNSRALSRVRIVIDSGQYHESANYRIELQDSREAFSSRPEEDEDTLDLRQAYLFLGADRTIWGLGLGRQELDLGSGRLLGADWHDNLDRSFDGVRLTLADRWWRFEPRQWSWRADIFAARPVEILDGEYNSGHGSPDAAGVFLSDRRTFPFRLDCALLYTRTGAANVPGELGDAGRERIVTLAGGVSGERFGRAEGVGLDLEAAVQFGRRASDDHFAAMGAAWASYTFPTPWRVRVRAGAEAGSGDEDPSDGESGTFRAPFAGDRRDTLGLLRLAGPANSLVYGAGISFGPIAEFRIGADVRWLRLPEPAAGWLDAGGRTLLDAGALRASALGRELDVSGSYRFTTESGKDVSIEGGWAVFEPGGGLPEGTGTVHGLYLQTSFRF
jgi:hypothetical protein